MRPIISKLHGNKFEWTSNITRFYNDIRSQKVLSKEEERALFRIIKTGTKKEAEEAKNILIESNLKLAVLGARAYATNQNIEELISEGYTGLLDAIEKFNLDKAIECDIKFSTYAAEYIRRNINQYRTNYGTMVRQTNRIKTIHCLSKAKNSFMQQYERQPTSNELLDWLNENYLDEKHKIDNPNDVEDLQISSIDEPLELGYDEEACNSGLMLSYNMATQESNSVLKEEEKEFQTKVIDKILSILNERDREIVKMCFGIGYPHKVSVENIAEKMCLTKERVRQIKSDSIKKIKEVFPDSILMSL